MDEYKIVSDLVGQNLLSGPVETGRDEQTWRTGRNRQGRTEMTDQVETGRGEQTWRTGLVERERVNGQSFNCRVRIVAGILRQTVRTKFMWGVYISAKPYN